MKIIIEKPYENIHTLKLPFHLINQIKWAFEMRKGVIKKYKFA